MNDDRVPDAPAGPAPALLPVMEPVRAYLGTWRGEGTGIYPTIESFGYREEVEFSHVGKPFLAYRQRTRHAETGLPLHAESGFWRVVTPADPVTGRAAIEAVIAHPSGLGEVLVGDVQGGRIAVATTEVARTPTAKEVTAVERVFELEGDVLTYELHMAAVGQPLQLHLRATLHRVS